MTTPKIYGLLIIAGGIPFGLSALDGRIAPAVFVCAGLIPIFFSAERINDERVQLLKMKALSFAMAAGLGLAFAAQAVFRAVGPREGGAPRDLTAYEFLAVILALSLGLFHFLRWQDGRTGEK